MEITQSHRLTEGKTKEKCLRSPLPVSLYYTTLDYNQGHHSVPTNPALCGSLTDPGCLYLSCFTSKAAPEVKVEWSYDLRAEQSLEMRAEQSLEMSGVEFQLKSSMEFQTVEV